MNGTTPVSETIVQHVLPYLNQRDLATCRFVNRAWYSLATVQSAREVECKMVGVPIQMLYYKRKGLFGVIKSLNVDISYIDGFLPTSMYERRIRDAASVFKSSLSKVCKLKIRMSHAQIANTAEENRLCSLSFNLLLDAFPDLLSLDLSDCMVSVLGNSETQLSRLSGLRELRWFSLGRNDMSSAATLYNVVTANKSTLRVFKGKGDSTDATLRVLSDAQNIQKLDLSGSNISDEALLSLVRKRGKTLHELVLSDCTRLTKGSISRLTAAALPNLVVLDLYNVMATAETYQKLFNIDSCWPYLQDLKLKAATPPRLPQGNAPVNCDILEAIGNNCPRLVSLRLFGCCGITDDGLSSVLGNLGYLRELVVMHSTSEPIIDDDTNDYDNSSVINSGTSTPTSDTGASDGDVWYDYSNDVDSDSGDAEGSIARISVLNNSNTSHVSANTNNSSRSNSLLLTVPSINDVWATMPSLPNNATPSQTHSTVAHMITETPPSTAPSSPALSDRLPQANRVQRVFTSQALRNGVRSNRFNLLNLDMEYDSICAEHFSTLTHLHVLCGRMITRHAKSLIESQFPKCKMMVWNVD